MSDRLRDHADGLAAAAVRYETLLTADPEQWDTLYLYGTALLRLGRLTEAADVFRRAAILRPGIPDVYNNLGVVYQAIGDADASVRAYRSAIEFNPDFDLAHANLARQLESVGRFAEAEISLRRAVRIKPTEVGYRLQLASVIGRQSKWPEATSILEEAVSLQPQNLELKMNLAAALVHQERLDAAVGVYRAVLDERPECAEAYSSLSFVLERQGHLSDALAAAERAVDLCPDRAEFQNNLGTILRSLHHLDDACRAFRTSIELSPDFALGRFNLGTTLLLAGRYVEGWTGYGQHARVSGMRAPGPPTTEWEGQPIRGRRLLVYADQGLGDTIQFARFLPLCKQRSEAHIVFRCQRPLRRLFGDRHGIDEFCTNEDDVPTFDWHIPLASLPGLFGLSIEQVGLGVPYLWPQVPLLPRIRDLLGGSGERRIGLVWQGNPRQARDDVRSCPLAKLTPLLEIPGIRFFSLQCDSAARAHLTASAAGRGLVDLGGLLGDFADTAAVLTQLDLLITVDTAIAHLAGALGRPVWTMLCHTPDWRWHLGRSDSAWYPTMRLFRQPTWGDWDSVVEQIRAALQTV
ncbi:MAG TPA: tetratricopeptide repeat protein [Planctomycetaceae bacterium]|nr:tetratricopeptide repeat protein [Planctomycetaceae bacterium]